MRIESEFIQLPLLFDSERLLAEVKALGRECWITHPLDPANLAIILISVGGTVNDEFANEGQMMPTAYLQACPYMQQVLAAFATPVSRTRLMIIPPGKTCSLHDDICFHWYRRTRIHVPIVTSDRVRFTCNGKAVHMRAGEAWIFDNFLPHSVLNEGDRTRIHLVCDTRGSPEFWQLTRAGELPFGDRKLSRSDYRYVAYAPMIPPKLELEPYAFDLLSPAEVSAFASQLKSGARDVLADAQLLDELDAAASELVRNWTTAFATYGNDKSGVPAYSAIMREFTGSALLHRLAADLPRYSDAGTALGVMQELFVKTIRDDAVAYTPDPALLDLCVARM